MPHVDPFKPPPTHPHLPQVSTPIVVGLIAIVIAVVVVVGMHLAPLFAGNDFHIDSSMSEVSQTSSVVSSSSEPSSAETTVCVYLTGCVVNPGLYEVPQGSRVADALELAGGFSDTAATDKVNIARIVTDGEQIDILSTEEAQAQSSFAGATSPNEEQTQAGRSALVNINTATDAELDTLPGVGPSLASKIIASRESEGRFTSKKDLQRVAGIGPKKYAALEDQICV